MEKKYRESWEYPCDNSDFAKIRNNKLVYVDKTDLIYQMTRNTCVFLSRPRRFGKSLLCSTLQAYFLGRRELFEGLKIMEREKEWTKHPVFRFDISALKEKTVEQMRIELFDQLTWAAKDNGLESPLRPSPGSTFQQLVKIAKEKTGYDAVIIIDEYDSPLLHIDQNDPLFAEVQSLLREFFITCKICVGQLRFVFITGITKFSHVSIFSELNNLNNISMDAAFAALCGITEDELHTQLDDDVEHLALSNGMSKEAMYDTLRWKYNGFHFSSSPEGVYNPYSIMLTFFKQQLGDYWFSSATPSFLFKKMQGFQLDLMKLNLGDPVESSSFDLAIQDMKTPLPLLYQSGYLTIKEFVPGANGYRLGIPNDEVRVGLFKNFMQTLTPLDTSQRFSAVVQMHQAFRRNDPDAALKALQSFLAGVPYLYEGQKAILEDEQKLEALHERDLYILFNGMGLNLQTQVTQAKGRVDMVVWLPDAIYIMEFKMRGTATAALNQIDKNHYAAPYMADPRPKVKIGIRFTTQKHTITSWKIRREG